MRTFDFNGVSLPFDIYNLDTLDRYESAFLRLAKAEKSIPKDGKQSDIIRANCEALRTLFDDILGDGAAVKLFGDRMSYAELFDAYETLVRTVEEQRDAIQSRVARYSPNRVTRRNKG